MAEQEETETATRTCIVADDEPGVRQFVTTVLSRAHFTVAGARNGREVTEYLATHACDLLVTDLAMPGGEGIETIRSARRLYPALKILAISGAFGKEMLRTAEILGADASLSKPFTAETLIAAVNSLLDCPDA
jgi:two-component system cell cycle sensor histidine kinase/response regulator CckA